MNYRYYLTGGHSGESTFPLGVISYTPAAYKKIADEDIATAMARHAHRDWGDMSEVDHHDNDVALDDGYPVRSVYHDRQGTTFWIVTETDRITTTVLLPEDY